MPTLPASWGTSVTKASGPGHRGYSERASSCGGKVSASAGHLPQAGRDCSPTACQCGLARNNNAVTCHTDYGPGTGPGFVRSVSP